jgi:hypothetical protein
LNVHQDDVACAPPPEGAFLEQIHPVIALCSDDVSFLFHINAAARKKNDERIMRKGQNDIEKQSVNDTHTNNAWPRGESIQVAASVGGQQIYFIDTEHFRKTQQNCIHHKLATISFPSPQRVIFFSVENK